MLALRTVQLRLLKGRLPLPRELLPWGLSSLTYDGILRFYYLPMIEFYLNRPTALGVLVDISCEENSWFERKLKYFKSLFSRT